MAHQPESRHLNRVVLFAALLKIAYSQNCEDVNICNAACIAWETANSFCNNYPVGYDNKMSCLCQWPDHQISSGSKASELNQCVVCNVNNVGPNPLAYYQVWTAICDTYAVNGEASAIAIANAAQVSVIEAFSSTLLPLLSSSYCGGAELTTMTTTPVDTVTTSTATTSFDPDTTPTPGTTYTVTTSAGPSATNPSAYINPTPSNAARARFNVVKKSTANVNDLCLAIFCIGAGLLGGLLEGF